MNENSLLPVVHTEVKEDLSNETFRKSCIEEGQFYCDLIDTYVYPEGMITNLPGLNGLLQNINGQQLARFEFKHLVNKVLLARQNLSNDETNANWIENQRKLEEKRFANDLFYGKNPLSALFNNMNTDVESKAKLFDSTKEAKVYSSVRGVVFVEIKGKDFDTFYKTISAEENLAGGICLSYGEGSEAFSCIFIRIPDDEKVKPSQRRLRRDTKDSTWVQEVKRHEFSHYIHHLILGSLPKVTEQNPVKANAFKMYRDEMIAFLTGSPIETNFNMETYLLSYKNEHPELASEIAEDFQRIIFTISAGIRIAHSQGVKPNAFIPTILYATSFDEIEQNIYKFIAGNRDLSPEGLEALYYLWRRDLFSQFINIRAKSGFDHEVTHPLEKYVSKNSPQNIAHEVFRRTEFKFSQEDLQRFYQIIADDEFHAFGLNGSVYQLTDFLNSFCETFEMTPPNMNELAKAALKRVLNIPDNVVNAIYDIDPHKRIDINLGDDKTDADPNGLIVEGIVDKVFFGRGIDYDTKEYIRRIISSDQSIDQAFRLYSRTFINSSISTYIDSKRNDHKEIDLSFIKVAREFLESL